MTNPSGIRPVDLRVLVKPDPVEEKTAGGIILARHHQRARRSTPAPRPRWSPSGQRLQGMGRRGRKPKPGAACTSPNTPAPEIKGEDGERLRHHERRRPDLRAAIEATQ
jgi:hypothetical protein